MLLPGGLAIHDQRSTSDVRLHALNGEVPLRIVYVDDDAELRHTFQRLFRRTHHEIAVYESAQEALERILQAPPDGILCDLNMPAFGGDAFFHRLESQAPQLTARVVFCSGGIFTDELNAFVDTHQPSLLMKPFTLAQLQALVRAWGKLRTA